jgi:SAM-dependent methyltransferase
MRKHWTERLFVDKASIYQEQLEELFEQAIQQVEELQSLLSELRVPEGGWILDLACGVGRHSTLLGEKGYRVVGVDLSPTFIVRAREIAEERLVSERVEFKVGDMRNIGELLRGFESRFAAVLSMFTSLGYYDEETDGRILAQLLELTVPGGILVIEIVNRDALIRRFQERDFFQLPDDKLQLAERRLDLETSRMHNVWRWYREEGRDLKHLETVELDHRVYSLHELKGLVEDSGWEYVGGYGGFQQEPLTMDSFRMVLVGRKPAA